MADRLRPSAARLTPAELTRESRANAQMARLAIEARCPVIASHAAKRAAYYRDRRAAMTRDDRAARRRAA